MASLTFGSVGDIITICGILKDVIKSLSNSRGASVEYQSLIKELQGLSQTVYGVRSLLRARPHLRNSQALHEILDNCKDSLLQEYHHVEPYRKALQSNQTTTAIHTIFRKIKWLSTRDDRIAFRATIASHLLAITGVLISSGIDATHELHRQTIDRLEEGFESLRIAGSQHLQVAAGHQTDIVGAVQQSETSLVIQHDITRQQAQVHHAEILKQFHDLQSTFSDIRQLKDSPVAGSVPICTRQTLVDRNKLYLTFIISLLSEFTKLGWIGVYQFWQIVRLIFLPDTLSLTPSRKCLTIHDAIMEYIYVDTNFVSYDDFIGLIEKKFQGTAGEHVITLGSYVFEDRKRHQLALRGAWSSDILAGRTLFMRAQVVTSSSAAGHCPHCGVQVKQKSDTDEHVCKCGLHYVAEFSTRKLPDLPISSESYGTESRMSNHNRHAFSSSVTRLSQRPICSSKILQYFKRVQTVIVDDTPTAKKEVTEEDVEYWERLEAEERAVEEEEEEEREQAYRERKVMQDAEKANRQAGKKTWTARDRTGLSGELWLRALYDFDGVHYDWNGVQQEGVSAFKKGEMFLLLTELESGWCDAFGKGGRCWIPGNFFELNAQPFWSPSSVVELIAQPYSMDETSAISKMAKPIYKYRPRTG